MKHNKLTPLQLDLLKQLYADKEKGMKISERSLYSQSMLYNKSESAVRYAHVVLEEKGLTGSEKGILRSRVTKRWITDRGVDWLVTKEHINTYATFTD